MGISINELVGWAINRVNFWKYNQKVPAPVFTKNAALNESFFEEIIGYLGKDLTDKLTPLMLTPQQSEIMEYALNLPLENYAACDDDLTGILSDEPCIKRSFETNAPYGTNQGQVKNARFVFRWNVTTESPENMIIRLYAELKLSGIIEFMFSKQKVTSEKQLDFMRSDNPWIVDTFRLYENGSRIVQKFFSLDEEEKDGFVTQYGLIGDFHSKAAHSHQWIYASNLSFGSDHDKTLPLGLTPRFY